MVQTIQKRHDQVGLCVHPRQAGLQTGRLGGDHQGLDWPGQLGCCVRMRDEVPQPCALDLHATAVDQLRRALPGHDRHRLAGPGERAGQESAHAAGAEDRNRGHGRQGRTVVERALPAQQRQGGRGQSRSRVRP